jgi:hypothetical protein
MSAILSFRDLIRSPESSLMMPAPPMKPNKSRHVVQLRFQLC